jgi:hypothetical protein
MMPFPVGALLPYPQSGFHQFANIPEKKAKRRSACRCSSLLFLVLLREASAGCCTHRVSGNLAAWLLPAPFTMQEACFIAHCISATVLVSFLSFAP